MRERPIIFSGPMVRALLDGRKTQTRRIIKTNHVILRASSNDEFRKASPYPLAKDTGKLCHYVMTATGPLGLPCPYGMPGDRLWVRETFWGCDGTSSFKWYVNPIFTPDRKRDECKLVPAIFMPRIVSRITLEITDVRVQRLQDTTRLDIADEGWPFNADQEGYINLVRNLGWGDDNIDDAAIEWYADLWDAINGKGSWDANPWIWALTFKVARPVSPHTVDR